MDDKEREMLEDAARRMTDTQKKNTRRLNRIFERAYHFPIPDMTEIIPEGEKGGAKIEHFEVPDDPIRTLRAMFSDPMHFIPTGKYVRLIVDGQLMMTNTLFERATAYPFLKRARGDILITGLGIGMILLPLLMNHRYTSITIVEKSQDVIDLVGPRFNWPKVEIICADAFDWHPNGKRFDTIWHDIWPTISEESLPEITKLKRRYGQWLKKGGWQGAWAQEKIKELQKKWDDEMAFVRRYNNA